MAVSNTAARYERSAIAGGPVRGTGILNNTSYRGVVYLESITVDSVSG